VEDLINKAGRQRMLCERMVKSYVQVVSGVAPRAAAGELAHAIGVFECQLAELNAALAQAEARARLAELEGVWQRFRLLAALPGARARVHEVRGAGARLLHTAERAAAALARDASGVGRFVDLAGRERMLCQRIAKDQLLIAEAYGDGAVREEMAFACVEFGRALAELRSAPCNTGELREALAIVTVAWRVLLELMRARGGARDQVLASAEEILQRMEHITSLYERLGATKH
jgi:hypothetical protein